MKHIQDLKFSEWQCWKVRNPVTWHDTISNGWIKL